MRYGSLKVTQMLPVHEANLVANSGNAAFGVAGANGVSAGSSLGWDTVGERYGHFYVENFRQLTALPKFTSISIKIGLRILGCMN